MRAVLLGTAALAAAGCDWQADDPSIPSDSDIARVEAALARHPCVGDLNLWERNYRFSRKSGLLSAYSLNPDLDVIEFHLRRAGSITIMPGRNIVRWTAPDWPDSNTILSLDGQYKLLGGDLSLEECEPTP